MSLGQDFLSGYQTTSGARERKRDRDDKISQEQLRRQFEIDRDLGRYKNEKERQDAQIAADAKKQFNQNFFAAGERDAQNRYGTGERIGSQDFTAGQNAAQRALQKEHTDRTLNQAAAQFTKRLDFDQQNMGLGAGLKAREQNWRENPENPENKWRDARADQVEDLRAPFAPPAPGAPKAPGAGTPKMITTKAEYDALPSGARFSWNGRNGVKN